MRISPPRLLENRGGATASPTTRPTRSPRAEPRGKTPWSSCGACSKPRACSLAHDFLRDASFGFGFRPSGQIWARPLVLRDKRSFGYVFFLRESTCFFNFGYVFLFEGNAWCFFIWEYVFFFLREPHCVSSILGMSLFEGNTWRFFL